MNDIEKCAKLMGYKVVPHVRKPDIILVCKPGKENSNSEWFAPLTNKSDLVDLECALSDKYTIRTIDEENGFYIEAHDAFSGESIGFSNGYLRDHHDKFAARAHAVIAVAVQIYDRTNP